MLLIYILDRSQRRAVLVDITIPHDENLIKAEKDKSNIYRKVAFIPKRDFTVALEKFTLSKKWKENACVIDIGSGDGSTTSSVLEKYVPPNYKKIIGCDVSAKMVEYANEHFRSDRIEYIISDITKPLPLYLRGAFDHAVSSYTFQRIKEQKAAFTYTYNSLKDGGTCLLLFLGRYPMYDVFRSLSHKEKWATDLQDVEKFISPYHDSKDPKSDVMSVMDSVGFKETEVDIFENTHTYDTSTFKNLVKAVNPFSVLNSRWDEFMADYFEVAPTAVKVDYQLIVAYGEK